MTCQHASAVPVESVAGERVSWLCPDCDAQLDADWRKPLSMQERRQRLADDHEKRHHGHPLVRVLGCPRCAEEWAMTRDLR